MISDPLPAIAPARIKALLLPIGKITADRFSSFADRLKDEKVVQLRDISPNGRPNRNMFSPLGYPDGAILYDLITHIPPASHLALSPFDLYREPLAVIAIADGKELQDATFSKRQSSSGASVSTVERNIRALSQELEDLRDNHPKAIVHQVVIFDYLPPETGEIPMPEGITSVPPSEDCKRTTVKTVMCEVSSVLLAEMTTLARSFEGMTTIESPGIYSPEKHVNGNALGGSGIGSDGGLGHTPRRNSQFALPNALSRSSSMSSGDQSKNHARMSMPPMPGRSASASAERPSTPPRSGLQVTPMSPDEAHSLPATGPSSPEQKQTQKSESDRSRDLSRDRVSVQGFGPGGANDRYRLRGKSRVSVLIGSMYLQAGRWNDSLKELSEGATAARSLNDHIWHGKALELILMNLFLLGWCKLEFQVPAVCQPSLERPTSSPAANAEAEASDATQPKHLKSLQNLLPELLDRILGLYSRLSSESLPPLSYAETTIRFCKILTAVHHTGGILNQQALNSIVTGDYPGTISTTPRPGIVPSRQQITSTLFKAFPSSGTELLTIADRTSILGGIANVLGRLGYQRKKAMVVRELVSVLIAGLVEARTRGAAEAGVHPAAGLVSLAPTSDRKGGGFVALDLGEGDIEHGIEAFLDLLCRSYGVVGSNNGKKKETKHEQGDDYKEQAYDDSDRAVIDRVLSQSSTRFFGFTEIKLNILRACINFSEALPDFNGVLKFSSDLMRTAGSGVAPGPKREDAAPVIHREEQVRLAANISRTANLVERIGMEGVAAEYWDEFLVRSVSLEPLPASRTPIPHAKAALPRSSTARSSQDVNPFIYNPFLKEVEQAAAECLVAGELATFKVMLQNTYDIEVEVESIRLDVEGVEFEASPGSTVLGPYRTQLVRLKGRPRATGNIKITGAVIKVRGCRERRFPIFTKHWKPVRAEKIKQKGPPTLDTRDVKAPAKPDVKVLSLDVVQPQPLVVIKSTTLPQSSVMILEGERQTFSVTMQNTSKTPVDFILFSFKDSTQEPLQAALESRDATPAELYEYELILMKRQALRLPRNDQPRQIAPGATATFEFEILGKPGLTNATIQADYTYLGVPRGEVTEQFYTRQLSLDLTVTVNASIEVARIDTIPLQGQIPKSLLEAVGGDDGSFTSSDDYCLLSVDLRNAWPGQLAVRLEGEGGLAVEDDLLPGKTSRVVIPVKRLHVEDAHAAVPSLNPSRQRQFVVSTSKISPGAERAAREAFWYREKLLETLKATWRTKSLPKRSGLVELRNMRLTPRMIESVKIDEVDIEISAGKPDDDCKNNTATAYVDEFIDLHVRIKNKSGRSMMPVVRVMPALCHRPLNVALEYTRKFAWNGTLQQQLPELADKETAEYVLSVTPLCRGQFELAASVEEVQTFEDEAEKSGGESGQEGSRSRSNTQMMMDAALGIKERRMWHSRQPLILTVGDREQ